MAEREDKRLDDLVEQVNHGFARVDGEIQGLRRDIKDLRTELRGDIGGLRTELKGDIGGLRTELEGDIGGLRIELRGDIGGLRTELRGEMHEGFARVDKQFERIHHWAVAIAVAMLGLLGVNVFQGLGGS